MNTPSPTSLGAEATRKLLPREEDFIRELYRDKANFKLRPAFVTTARPVPMGSTDNKGPWGGSPARIIPPGTTLRIVMVSRFDDCGLTDDLDATHGYDVRLGWDNDRMTDIRPTKEPSP